MGHIAGMGKARLGKWNAKSPLMNPLPAVGTMKLVLLPDLCCGAGFVLTTYEFFKIQLVRLAAY
jgi:hypothetical protein